MVRSIILLFLLICSGALAHPPDDPNYEWFKGLRVPWAPSASCCQEHEDCRGAVARMGPNGWEVFVDRKTFGFAAPDNWMSVPERAIEKGKENPTGEPVLCFANGRILCFVPAAGT